MGKNDMTKLVFLDLEGTVISLIEDQSYSTTELFNIQLVRKWLKDQGVSAVGIFSFAIDNDVERITFMNSWLRKALEEGLGVTVGNVITVEEVRNSILRKNRVKLEDLWEVKQLWGKERGFVDHCKVNFKNCECVLLDDLVDDMTMNVKDLALIIETVNVDNLRIQSRQK